MKIDRALQNQILEELKKTFPSPYALNPNPFKGIDDQHFMGNLSYLVEHGLVQSILGARDLELVGHQLKYSKITAKGLDFLEQDGGLSAILGTVTVKLHADTIRDMLEAKIMASGLPDDEKKTFMDTLKELPGEALKTLSNKLIEMACENPQAVWDAVKNIAS
ncbi:hypothetical protein [Chromobacterium violaceum]|uniref:hypothetical protein n=1 Tax=Chromobacterium violaceum TaxID=536 RepID=UPI001C8BCCEB|nr:hypothetical protein [Chromobacterium violaceum]MBX9268763.1 hypothetical protein [Chromobacterium violaceum]